MEKNGLLVVLIFMVGIFAACKKTEAYNDEAQYSIDEGLIKNWADTSGISLIKDTSGLYYHIVQQGDGQAITSQKDYLEVLYKGQLLTDSVFSNTVDTVTYKFVLEKAIPGWRIGLPLIKEGGQIILLVPSKLAYRNYIVGGVPENSVLNFTIDLKKVVKK